jgi:hypothetical protein
MSTVSSIEYATLLARLEALEISVSRIATAITKFVTVDQVTQLGLLKQTEVSNLETRVTALENQVEALEGFHQP